MNCRRGWMTGLALCFASMGLAGAGQAAAQTPAFPESWAWLSGTPRLSMTLRGKVVLVGDLTPIPPHGNREWVRVAGEHKNQPLLVVCRVVGCSPSNGRKLLGKARAAELVVSDHADLSKPVAGKFSLINNAGALQEIGTLGDPSVSTSAANAVARGRWRIDEKDVPRTQRRLWRLFELGAYDQVHLQLMKQRDAKGEEAKFHERVAKEMADDLKRVTEFVSNLQRAGRYWEAYRVTQVALKQFRHHPGLETLEDASQALAREEAVLIELRAAALLETAGKYYDTVQFTDWRLKPTRLFRNAAFAAYDKLNELVENYAATDAGIQAKVLFDKLPHRKIRRLRGRNL